MSALLKSLMHCLLLFISVVPAHVHIKVNVSSSWTENDYVHQFAHAFDKRGTGNITRLETNGLPSHERSDLWFEKEFSSELFDGTKVTIKFVKYHGYDMGSTFNNHYHIFLPKF